MRNLLERLQLIELEWRFARGDAARRDAEHTKEARSSLARDSSHTAQNAALAVAVAALNLTQREREVLKILSDGHSNVQIGESLHLSPRTVEKYVSSLLRKTDTSNRAELVRFAMEHHLVE